MQAFIVEHMGLNRLSPLIFVISILLFIGIGWVFGEYRLKKQNGAVPIRDSLVTAIFSLSALVLGFAFSTATSNYYSRIDTNRAQASAIKEVYVSVKYLNPVDQQDLKRTLKELLAFRLEALHNTITPVQLNRNGEQVISLVRKINEDTIAASQRVALENRPLIDQILNPALINLTTVFNKGVLKMKSHPPELLMQFLFILLSIGGLLIGSTMAIKKEHDWFLAILYVALIGVCLYVILSFEYPQLLMSHQQIDDDLFHLKAFIESSSH